MKRFLILVVLTMLAIMSATACWGVTLESPVLTISRLAGGVTIDGQSNDLGWAGQTPIVYGSPDTYLDNRNSPEEPVGLKCLFGCDAVWYYFYLEGKDTEIVSKPWSGWKDGDSFVMGLAFGTTETVVLVKPTSEMRLMTPGSDVLNTSAGSVVTRITPALWIAEGKIPISELGTPPTDGKIKFAVVQRNWNAEQNDFSATGSGQRVAYATEGSVMWDPAIIETVVKPPTVASTAIKTFPESVTFKSDLLWNVTYVDTTMDTTRFVCEDNSRIHAVEVVCSGSKRPQVHDLVVSVTGKMVAKRLVADDISFMPGYGKGMNLQPWGMTSKSISPLNKCLAVRLVGTVKQPTPTGFILFDGWTDTAVQWSSFVVAGTHVTVTGVASSDATGVVILATEVK